MPGERKVAGAACGPWGRAHPASSGIRSSSARIELGVRPIIGWHTVFRPALRGIGPLHISGRSSQHLTLDGRREGSRANNPNVNIRCAYPKPAILILGPAGSLREQGGGVDGTFG